MKKWYYERNSEFLNGPLNKTFEEVLWMTKEEFRQWVIDLRASIAKGWDEQGIPPRVGSSTDEMIQSFRQLEPFVTNTFECVDEYANERNVIRCTSNLGNAVNQFFPTMMKTPINYTKDPSTGKSIYDYFTKDELFPTFLLYATRHFKRDGFYDHSTTVKQDDIDQGDKFPVAKTGIEWVQKYAEGAYFQRGYDYWLCPAEEGSTYTGYNTELRNQKFLNLTRKEIESLGDTIPNRCMTNVDWEKSEFYSIRSFRHGDKMFPAGFKAFRVSYCQYAVNFPPLVAKYIYERFTAPWKQEETIYVWDPSSGWGGRLLGALSVEDGRHITYLGNDPNTDHNTHHGRTKYHEVHSFYCQHVKKGGGLWDLPHNELQFWQKGSEDMQHDKVFRLFKGKISLVFTSPPYFAKEAYSTDPTQSYKKFGTYEAWRDGFLRETIKTAAEWLRPGGYLAWNIADVKFGTDTLPLEEDSRRFAELYGLEYMETLKMSLASMPGGDRLDEVTGLPKTKNFCKVNGIWLKYEPIFIFRKTPRLQPLKNQ